MLTTHKFVFNLFLRFFEDWNQTYFYDLGINQFFINYVKMKCQALHSHLRSITKRKGPNLDFLKVATWLLSCFLVTVIFHRLLKS